MLLYYQIAASSLLIGEKQDIFSLAREYSNDDSEYLSKIEVILDDVKF